MDKHIYTIIPEGKYKGMRLYDITAYGGEHVFPWEMYHLYLNALKNNYKIFVIKNTANHNIKIPDNDLKFLETSLEFKKDEQKYINHEFSDETLKIKELQYKDVNQIYDISNKYNNVGAVFIYPVIKNNLYCFDIFLIVKCDFDLNLLLNLNFNIIKIDSFVEYNKNNLNIELMQKLYNLDNLSFKDYTIPRIDIKKTRPYELLDLQEKIELDRFYQLYIDAHKKNSKPDLTYINKKINEWELKLSAKEYELWDIEMYKKLHFSKLCMHFYFFHEIIVSDTVFFTNFLELVNGVAVNFENTDVILDYESLQHYSLEDMFINDQYRLFSIMLTVYFWKKK